MSIPHRIIKFAGQDKDDIIRVVRILEYEGPREWVEITLERAAVPMEGQATFLNAPKTIRSRILDFAEHADADKLGGPL